MADPLFNVNLAAVKARLRLTGVPSGVDADAMIQSALRTVRVNIYSRLGVSTVDGIVALASIENPTTADAITRGIAEQLEVLWTRVVLLDQLPTLFMDSGAGSQEFMNQEGLNRSMRSDLLENQLKRFLAQIEEWLGLLAGEVELGDNSSNVLTNAPQLPTVYPLGSLIGQNQRLWGNPKRPIPGENG